MNFEEGRHVCPKGMKERRDTDGIRSIAPLKYAGGRFIFHRAKTTGAVGIREAHGPRFSV